MDEAAFRRFLKQSGKKEHVVDGLVSQVLRFDEYLARERQVGLDAACAHDLEAYMRACEGEQKGSARKRLRALALYFRHAGNEELASLASSMREERIAATRRSFPLKDFRSVNMDDLARLEAIGVTHAGQMLAAGRTPGDRDALAQRTGVSPAVILELVMLSDLSRISGVKAVRARLYHDGGFDTLDKIAASDPEAMRVAMAAFVARTGFDGIPPLPKEARNTVAEAQVLPRLVEY